MKTLPQLLNSVHIQFNCTVATDTVVMLEIGTAKDFTKVSEICINGTEFVSLINSYLLKTGLDSQRRPF